MDLKEFEVAELPTETILPSKINPNHMSEFMFKSLVEGIKKDGFMSVIAVRKEDNRIIDGNHRWKAAKEAGIEKIRCVMVDCTEQQAMKLGVALNQKKGYFDYTELRDVINSLEKEDLNVLSYDLGFTEQELQRLSEESSFDSEKIIKQKLLEAGISSDKVDAMADVYKTGDFQELPKTGITGKQEGLRYPIIFFVDEEEDFVYLKEFFKTNDNREPDTKKLLEMARNAEVKVET